MSIQQGDQPEIPAVCDRCLGPNPYIEMIRDYNGAECRLCTRPFTVFEWTPVKGERFKKTIICLTCARSKNCCQSCMLDLTYGLDLQLRDSVLKLAGEEVDDDINTPTNAITKAYRANQLDAQYANGLIKQDGEEEEGRAQKARELLAKVAKSQAQQQQKNLAKSASKEAKKEQKPLSKEELQKLISKLPFNGNLQEKSGDDTKSFFIFGVTEELPDYAIKNYFEKQFSVSLASMSINHKAKAGYIVFKNAASAAKVASQVLDSHTKAKNFTGEYNRPAVVVIENVPLRVCWGKAKSLGATNSEFYKIAAVVKKQMKVLADKDLKSAQSDTV